MTTRKSWFPVAPKDKVQRYRELVQVLRDLARTGVALLPDEQAKLKSDIDAAWAAMSAEEQRLAEMEL